MKIKGKLRLLPSDIRFVLEPGVLATNSETDLFLWEESHNEQAKTDVIMYQSKAVLPVIVYDSEVSRGDLAVSEEKVCTMQTQDGTKFKLITNEFCKSKMIETETPPAKVLVHFTKFPTNTIWDIADKQLIDGDNVEVEFSSESTNVRPIGITKI